MTGSFIFDNDIGLHGHCKKVTYEVTESGCWNCTSHVKNRDGYAVFRRPVKQRWLVHRYVYSQLHKGVEMADKVVMHTCDNPACVNPEHLRLGTHSDNANDMVKKGRQVLPPVYSGSSHPSAKITEVCVRTMRKLRNEKGFTSQFLADAFGLKQAYVSKLCLGGAWANAGGATSSQQYRS